MILRVLFCFSSLFADWNCNCISVISHHVFTSTTSQWNIKRTWNTFRNLVAIPWNVLYFELPTASSHDLESLVQVFFSWWHLSRCSWENRRLAGRFLNDSRILDIYKKWTSPILFGAGVERWRWSLDSAKAQVAIGMAHGRAMICLCF